MQARTKNVINSHPYLNNSTKFYTKLFNPFKSDQCLISPYINAAESLIRIMRIQEMISNLINFDH